MRTWNLLGPTGLALAFATTFACGLSEPDPGEPPAFRVVEATNDTAGQTFADLFSASLPGPVEALGVGGDGLVVARADNETWVIDATGPQVRPLFAEAGQPEVLGQIRAISPRAAGGAWIASDRGLFVLSGAYVSFVDLPSSGMPRGVSEAAGGAVEGVWVAADDGLFRWRTGSYERLTIDGNEGLVSSIATDSTASSAFVVGSSGLVLVNADGDRLVSEPAPIEPQGFTRVAAGGGTLFGAGPSGLARWRSSDTPSWTHFVERNWGDGEIAVDPVSGVLWVRKAGSLLRIDGDEVFKIVLMATRSLSNGSHVAVDRRGDVWIDDGSDVVRLAFGVTGSVSFDSQLKPWLQTHCSECHYAWTDYSVFTGQAEVALTKVRAGDMPRCYGGVVCSPDERLAQADYEILESWIRGGKQP